MWKETIQTAPWMLCCPVEMYLAYYGGSYIPALSSCFLSPLPVVLPRLLISAWFISCISCIFLLCFKLIKPIVLTKKPFISGLVGVGMNPSWLQQQCTRFAVFTATFALLVVCIRLHLVLAWATWECCSCQWELGKASCCHHFTRNLRAFGGLMCWWFWLKDWIWLVKCSIWF